MKVEWSNDRNVMIKITKMKTCVNNVNSDNSQQRHFFFLSTRMKSYSVAWTTSRRAKFLKISILTSSYKLTMDHDITSDLLKFNVSSPDIYKARIYT